MVSILTPSKTKTKQIDRTTNETTENTETKSRDYFAERVADALRASR